MVLLVLHVKLIISEDLTALWIRFLLLSHVGSRRTEYLSSIKIFPLKTGKRDKKKKKNRKIRTSLMKKSK